MRDATGPFVGEETVALRTVYEFGELQFVVREDFPENLVAVVADAVLANIDLLPEASSPEDVAQLATLHPGARWAIEEYLDPTHRR